MDSDNEKTFWDWYLEEGRYLPKKKLKKLKNVWKEVMDIEEIQISRRLFREAIDERKEVLNRIMRTKGKK